MFIDNQAFNPKFNINVSRSLVSLYLFRITVPEHSRGRLLEDYFCIVAGEPPFHAPESAIKPVYTILEVRVLESYRKTKKSLSMQRLMLIGTPYF